MLVYIAGAGAIGCNIGFHLQKYTDSEVILLDTWQAHVDAINAHGLTVTGKIEGHLPMRAMQPTEASEPADLVVVITKARDLVAMMDAIKPIITDKTELLCLLNGMGHEEILKHYVDMARINLGVTIWSAGLSGAGQLNVTGIGTIDLQNIGGNETTGQQIAQLLNQAHLHVHYDDNVRWAIWRKIVFNGIANALCTILECTVGELAHTDTIKAVAKDMVLEYIAVAKAEGVTLDYDEMVTYLKDSAESIAGHHPSMYQDLIIHNRKTEIDNINGAVVKKGEKHGISTPVNRLLTELIHTKEQLRGAR
ncbi:2-dehydropantoate 2-reductase [Faucicola atlantae]|uniref:2-dehydropantoate 2-reductase n=1 Tax=Faucicola atlantae TaxID=34059 RepID=UPI0025B23159|nr:2-dehydropantoate 2-reductase [Moraxella atlantae]